MALKHIMDRPMSLWMKGSGPDRDVVLGSRIRLARNLAGVPFPAVADGQRLEAVVAEVRAALHRAPALQRLQFVSMAALRPLERRLLVERHLISPRHAGEAAGRALALRDDEAVSVMINEEDHVRIQVLMPGLQLSEAWAAADEIDNAFDEHLSYAFEERRGYLTACPTNVGTGLRASVMVHLPALAMTKQMHRIVPAVGKFGLVVRGLYGEGTQASGNIFQFSNQVTLGHPETEIMQHLINVTRQVIDQEREARRGLLRRRKIRLEDRVARAYGTLAHARVMSSAEALQLLSDVRLGIDTGLIRGLPPQILQELLVAIRPAHLQKRAGRDLGPDARDEYRATLIRERIVIENEREQRERGR